MIPPAVAVPSPPFSPAPTPTAAFVVSPSLSPLPPIVATSTPIVDQVQSRPQEEYEQTLSVLIPVGREPGSVDVPRNASGFGPQSFAVDRQGNTNICDTINRRIQQFAADGSHRMTIPVAEPLVPWDVAVDDGGNIYVLDDTQGMLDQHDHQGRLKRRISVVVTHPRGPMHIVSGMLYLSSLSGDCPIGAIVNGRLEPVLDPDQVMPQHCLEGIVGRTSGLLYSTQTTDHIGGLIDMFDRAGSPVRTIRIADPALTLIVFSPQR
jgi:hypothetical protein